MRIGQICLFAVSVLGCLPGFLAAQTEIVLMGHIRSDQYKDIPGARVTASGMEVGPAIADSRGWFEIHVKGSPGELATFRVEREGYAVLVEKKGIVPKLPLEFVLVPTKRPGNKEAIKSLASGLKFVDVVYRQLDCDQPPCAAPNTPFAVQMLEQRNANDEIDKLVFIRAGAGGVASSIVGEISAADLSRLGDDDKVALVVYEDATQRDYKQWQALSSKLEDPGVKPEDKKVLVNQLLVVSKSMCGNFDNILTVLKGINTTLWDHYASIGFVCKRLRQAHVGNHP
jgi:hypothetical protein